MYQEFCPPSIFDGWMSNVGAWMIGDSCAGIRVREEQGLIIKSWSRCAPHIIL